MASGKKRTAAETTAPRADLLEKDPSPLHVLFAEWLTDQTGYDVDEKTVQLATVLRMAFQKSEENQKDLAARKAAKAAAEIERERRAQERAAAKAVKAAEPPKAKKTAKKAAATTPPAAEDEETGTAAPPAKRAPKKRTAA